MRRIRGMLAIGATATATLCIAAVFAGFGLTRAGAVNPPIISVYPNPAVVGEAVYGTVPLSALPAGAVSSLWLYADCGVGAMPFIDWAYLARRAPDPNAHTFTCVYTTPGAKTIRLLDRNTATALPPSSWPSIPTSIATASVSVQSAPTGGSVPPLPAGAIVFDKPGTSTWKVPDGVTKIRVWAWGAGGAGSWQDQDLTFSTGGGGGGGFGGGDLAVTPGASYQIVVGAGGAGGVQFGPTGSGFEFNRGAKGGDSSFGDMVVARGGEGGVVYGGPDPALANAGHGAGASAPIAIRGGDGEGVGSGDYQSGRGGTGAGGGGAGGEGAWCTPVKHAQDGQAPGGGGGGGGGPQAYGCPTGSPAGKGGNGKVVVAVLESNQPDVQPLPTKAVTSRECGGKVDVSWERAKEAWAKGYFIIRAEKDLYEDSSALYIATKVRGVEQVSYVDTTPKPGTRYWYYVLPASDADLAFEEGHQESRLTASLLAQVGGSVSRGFSGSQVFNTFGATKKSDMPAGENSAVSSAACPTVQQPPEPKGGIVCRPAEGTKSESGSFTGTLKAEGTAATAALLKDQDFTLECWGTNELGARITEIAKETVKSKMVAPDFTASTPTVAYVSGPKSCKENQNIFAEGATIKITGAVENIGTAASPATKATWRGTEGITPLAKVADFGKLDPVENVGALGIKKNATLSRNIEKLRIGQFQLGMCADDDPSTSSGQGKVNELSEANNCSPAPVKLAVVPSVVPPAASCDEPEKKPQPEIPTTTGKAWDGWLKLSGVAKDGNKYGVRYDPDTTRFCGHAWGGEVVGWVKFGPLPEEIPLRPEEDKQARAGWICDQTRTVDEKGIISAPPYRVVPGSSPTADSPVPDWVRVENTAKAQIEVEEDKWKLPLVAPYDNTLVNQSYTLTGWAWSSNIGWISMSSTTVPTNPKADYGVKMEVKADALDKTSGRALKGYAWSSNIGWIKFDAVPYNFKVGGENYPEPRITEVEKSKPPSWLNITSGMLEGWARACAATVDGNCSSATGDYHGQR